jgi:putative ABC transport system ATP-binding protein
MANLIQLENIYKTYQTGQVRYEALKDVTLTVNYGDFTAIVGPSGSGKSTLIQIIGCLSTPTSGRYLLAGKEVSKLSPNELAIIRNKNVGFVFQNFNLLASLTVLENVALPLVYRGVDFAQRKSKAEEMLAKVDLIRYVKHRANELSGGQQQRVAIARALVTDPDIVLADEPTGNLDSTSGCEIMKLLLDANQRGKTIIIVTHDLDLVKQAQRIIKICDGKIIGGDCRVIC